MLGTEAAHIAIYARSVIRIGSAQVLCRRMLGDAPATAQQLFAVLRGFATQNVKLIWIENPSATLERNGVRDRLGRTAAS